MDSILTFTSGATADIWAYPTQIFTDVWIVIALAVGVPLAFYVIRKIITLVRSR
jgi:hypothetical protein